MDGKGVFVPELPDYRITLDASRIFTLDPRDLNKQPHLEDGEVRLNALFPPPFREVVVNDKQGGRPDSAVPEDHLTVARQHRTYTGFAWKPFPSGGKGTLLVIDFIVREVGKFVKA